MTERHGGERPLLRTAPVSASHRMSESGESHDGLEWRESRNGLPASLPYVRSTRDAEREAEVAAQLAAIRAEALRRARDQLGPVPLQRRTSGGTWATWEPCEDEGAAE